MAEFWEFVLTLLLGLLILQYLKQLWSSRNYPPGPFQLPIIGGIWRMAMDFSHDILIKLAKQYGNIYTIWLGPRPIVVLSGFQAVKEGIIDHPDDFNARPVSAFVQTALKRTVAGGILFASGDIWKQHRRFGVVTLRKMGVGRKIMEYQIEVEAKHLVETFACTKGQPYNPLWSITNAVSNVICAVAFGNRYSVEDEEFKGKIEAMEVMGKYATSIPALSKDDPTSTYSDDNLTYFLTELFIAGTETTATSLQWALLFMVAYPEIQGARVCLGEQMAKMELFLFFTHLLRMFKFQLPEGVKELNKEPVLGFSLHPHPYKICAIPRNMK
ncbi:hypothetical protein JD844_007965 [Phrynosoma platyrhinos]|uniref:Uncharacterized protein n=1 Tax=Phrynosoma platyrhinos TaxID=52577 RepID=A0ABQ7T3U6_PHRPL|nr:hypothetical protein JD844_007965 [Phrynosoma platyrhinos]